MSLITSGWLAKPAGKLRLRRSTVVLLVLFLGLGALYLQIRTEDEGNRRAPDRGRRPIDDNRHHPRHDLAVAVRTARSGGCRTRP